MSSRKFCSCQYGFVDRVFWQLVPYQLAEDIGLAATRLDQQSHIELSEDFRLV